jgi:hypothetical protein
MPERTTEPVVLEGVRIIFTNFSGEARKFNPEGNRNFNACLDDVKAKEMEAAGWNVRWLPPKNEDDSPQAVIKVNVKYERRDGTPTRPPQVVVITSKGKKPLDKSTISVLDWADIINADMIINPYHYVGTDGKEGISAYLKSLFVMIREDQLEMKYLDVQDASDDGRDAELAGEGTPF